MTPISTRTSIRTLSSCATGCCATITPSSTRSAYTTRSPLYLVTVMDCVFTLLFVMENTNDPLLLPPIPAPPFPPFPPCVPPYIVPPRPPAPPYPPLPPAPALQITLPPMLLYSMVKYTVLPAMPAPPLPPVPPASVASVPLLPSHYHRGKQYE